MAASNDFTDGRDEALFVKRAYCDNARAFSWPTDAKKANKAAAWHSGHAHDTLFANYSPNCLPWLSSRDGKGKKMAQATTASDDTRIASEKTATEPSKMTESERDAAASKVVDRYALWSGAAGLIPLPIADVAAVSGVQLQMLRRLSQIYDVPFSENLGKSVIASLAGSLIPASTAVGIVSSVKGVPAIGTTIGVLTMPAISAGAAYLIGKVFIQHFASGGTLLDFNPPDYREFIKAQKERLGMGASAKSVAPDTGGSIHRPTSEESD